MSCLAFETAEGLLQEIRERVRARRMRGIKIKTLRWTWIDPDQSVQALTLKLRDGLVTRAPAEIMRSESLALNQARWPRALFAPRRRSESRNTLEWRRQ